MNRRNFLNISLPATGAILIGTSLIQSQALADIHQQFSGKGDFDAYDVVINGAGMSGYFAAIHAAKKGHKVLLVEKRSSPGYEITAKGKLWLGADGFDKLRPEFTQVLLPAEEAEELQNKTGKGFGNSQFGDEVLLFSGSVRKGLLKSLLANKVHVLMMTDVCGILSDDQQVQGVVLASKHGIHSVKCKSFIDASDQLLFSRALLGQPYKIKKAGFVLEVLKADKPQKKSLKVTDQFGISEGNLKFHQGKRSADQLMIEFEFPVSSQNLEEIEHQARLISGKLGASLPTMDASLKKANINQFPLETSIYLEDSKLPVPKLKGHYLLADSVNEITGKSLLQTEAAAQAIVNGLKFGKTGTKIKTLAIIGSEIPASSLTFTDVDEPGLSVPLQTCAFNYEQLIKNKQQCQVLVAGGGTAGALAALGAVDKGANTIVVDYFNDLGGTKTMGGVMGYYHGVKEHKFFKKQNDEAERIAFETNMSKKTGRKLYHLQGITKGGGRFLAGAMMCGSVVGGNTLKGILICRHGKLEVIQSNVTVDGTGDGDIAAFAGAAFALGSSRTGETQNYSQWDVAATGKLPSATNRDYDIIDNTKISELQRALFLSHHEAHHYDFHPFLTVRESRRIEGIHILDLIDAVEGRHFEDVLALASSDFDPHNTGTSEFTKCGFLLPHSNDITVEIPYRCIVPKTLDGLLISGRGISQTHNALQFTRMTADLIVLGYMTGQIAADVAWKNIQPRKYDVSRLQKEWADLGYLPADYAKKPKGDLRNDDAEINRRITELAKGAPEYLYECSRLPKEKALPLLTAQFKTAPTPQGKLLVAKALAWFGSTEGNDLIETELKDLFAQELEMGYPKGYVDEYDSIRGRKKNMLEGIFWKINQNIALLAMSPSPENNDTIQYIIENTASGGGMVERTSEYYNGRIDLKIIPFHNRILNLCFYADRVADPKFITAFEKLLTDPNIRGFQTEEYDKVRWRVFGGGLELNIAAALARCGSKTGYDLLVKYLDDVHYNFKNFAASELKTLTKSDYGFNAAAWKKHTAKLSYPQPGQSLKAEIEV
ncbi:FAD-dependent oxidoreductase [Dyadobacter psychrotolerans]|uniref:FAD-dependent oxidoreductase n=1 Tax=Dyadobacter psychrotolerans TaxID=2541721 RepID=A0A4R5E226_9BACT|nr:FAD-dependent oxidoreductase [Dyadobacter psychrotolerans]TDE18275.1 FAD-dependent oxidoreductase [Dyadobacter psychrotolerans]